MCAIVAVVVKATNDSTTKINKSHKTHNDDSQSAKPRNELTRAVQERLWKKRNHLSGGSRRLYKIHTRTLSSVPRNFPCIPCELKQYTVQVLYLIKYIITLYIHMYHISSYSKHKLELYQSYEIISKMQYSFTALPMYGAYMRYTTGTLPLVIRSIPCISL